MTVVNEFKREVPIIYGATSLLATDAVNLVSSDIQPNAKGRRELPAGLFCARVNGVNRFLPRTRLSTAVAANATTVVLKEPNAQFKANDVLWVLGSYARLTVTASVTGTVYYILVNGKLLSVTASSNTATTLASEIVGATASVAEAFWADLNITRSATGAVVELFSTDSWSIQASPEITVWTSTNDGYFGNYFAPIGTLSSTVAPTLNATTGVRTYTLTTPNVANKQFPANCIVGTIVEKLLGVHIQAVDLTEDAPYTGTEFSVAPIRMADGVYENNLPYIDELIKRDVLISQLNVNPINTPFDNTRNFVTSGAFPIGIN